MSPVSAVLRPATRALVVLGAVATLLLGGVAPAGAQPGQGARELELVAAVNAERARVGLAPLGVSPRLTQLARVQSQENAARGRLSHSDDLQRQIRDWRALWENVGYGGSPAHVHRMLMDSRRHRANMLAGSSRRMGIGVVTDRAGRVWVTQIFVQPR